MIGRQPLSPAAMLDFLRTHVYIDGDCRIWAGSTNGDGYPVVAWNYRRRVVRRLLLELVHGRQLGRHINVWTTCGQVGCVAERHLRSGDRGVMLRAMSKDGRLHGGPKHALAVAMGRAPMARLGIDRAGEVYAALGRGETRADIAARYGVTTSAVGFAIRRWRRAGVSELNVRSAA